MNKQITLEQAVEKRKTCENGCKYYDYCGGGCPMEDGCDGFEEKFEKNKTEIDKILVENEDLRRYPVATQRVVLKDIFENIEMILNSKTHPQDADVNNISEIENSVLFYGLKDCCGKSYY